jgi:hypothetical protein
MFEPVEYQLLELLLGLFFKCMKELPSKVSQIKICNPIWWHASSNSYID